VIRLSGQDGLAVRAGKKMTNDSLLTTAMGPAILRHELDRVPLWRDNHVEIQQLVQDFASYLYLPRLQKPAVLLTAIRDGLGLLTWENDSFAYADEYDGGRKRYKALRCGERVNIAEDDPRGLLVKSAVALTQQNAEIFDDPCAGVPSFMRPRPPQPHPRPGGGTTVDPDPVPPPPPAPRNTRYFGTVDLNPERVGRDASKIADEVISHLVGLVGANVTVSLEIHAEIPDGAPDHVVRIVTENGRVLKFKTQGFAKE